MPFLGRNSLQLPRGASSLVRHVSRRPGRRLDPLRHGNLGRRGQVGAPAVGHPVPGGDPEPVDPATGTATHVIPASAGSLLDGLALGSHAVWIQDAADLIEVRPS